MAGEIFVHACHILKRAETCLVAGQNIYFSETNFLVNLRSSSTQKNLFPLSWRGERAYSKSRAPTEIGHQTKCSNYRTCTLSQQTVLIMFKCLFNLTNLGHYALNGYA